MHVVHNTAHIIMRLLLSFIPDSPVKYATFLIRADWLLHEVSQGKKKVEAICFTDTK